MKKLLVGLIFVFTLIVSVESPHTVEAHDLLPVLVREYIEANPDATAEEIRTVAEGTEGPAQRLLEASASNATSWSFIRTFVMLGIEHILIGTDHILFLLALMLTAYSVRQIMRLSLTFTLAHSLTFILAGTTALTISSHIVEPIIALSIAVVALLGLSARYAAYEKNGVWSLGIIFVFGLFHGLGFAGLLQDLQIPTENFVWSLVLFNVGIELGQMLIIVPVFFLLLLIQKQKWWTTTHVTVASALAFIGIVWGIQRILL